MAAKNILSTKSNTMQVAVKQAPLLPGCYLYKDSLGKIVYIGKAKVLRNRLRSYFSNYNRVEEKIRQMIDLAVSVEVVTTDSEIEALILEANLIKKYKPKYNSMLVDDKHYAYVKFDKVNSSNGQLVPIPTISVVRPTDEKFAALGESTTKDAHYFGPFSDIRVAKRLIRKLRKVYPFCQSNLKVIIPPKFEQLIEPKQKQPCFYYHIGLCNGVCAGQATRGDLEQNLHNIRRFFAGEKPALIAELEREMSKASKAQDFEQAAKLRNMLFDIKYIGSNISLGHDIDEVKIIQVKHDRRELALSELVAALGFPADKLIPSEHTKIECYDISNIQGKYAVGSMVVSVGGQAAPELYRRFRIKLKDEPNDFAMMQEMLARRLSHSEKAKPDASFSKLPDLMIIDGGKGQLSAAFEVLTAANLSQQIPIVGLAKQEEEIFRFRHQFDSEAQSFDLRLTDDPLFAKIRLPRRSEALYLVQRIRDEAHRFAITYHRKLRSKNLTASMSSLS